MIFLSEKINDAQESCFVLLVLCNNLIVLYNEKSLKSMHCNDISLILRFKQDLELVIMYLAQTLKDRIKALCKSKNISMEQLLSECSLGTNAIRQISDSKGMASFSLAKIADYLGCSVDYLLGRTEVPKGISGDDLSEHEKELIAAYRNKPAMQDSIDKLLDVPKEKVYYVKVAARNGGGIKEIALTDKDIEAINNLPDVDDL